MMDTRERLAALLKDSKVSQSELARRMGVERDWVNRRLPGASRPLQINSDDIPRLARALGVPVSAFFEETGPGASRYRQNQEDAFLGDLAVDITSLERETLTQFVEQETAEEKPVKITYDPEVDAVYIQLREGEPSRAVDVSEGVTADLDVDGNLIGLEVLDATERMGSEGLDSLSFELLSPRLRKSA